MFYWSQGYYLWGLSYAACSLQRSLVIKFLRQLSVYVLDDQIPHNNGHFFSRDQQA